MSFSSLISWIIIPLALASGIRADTYGRYMRTGEESAIPPIDYIAFSEGEELAYSLQFGKINAGEAKLKVNKELKTIGGQPHYDVEITGRSFSIFDPFYKVRDYYESFINTNTLMPTAYIRDVQEGSFEIKESYLFNHDKDVVISSGKEFQVRNNMHDLVSAFYYLRCIDFSTKRANSYYPINIFFEEETLNLGIQYTGKKKIKTSLGKIDCYVFKPKLAEGRVFKDQSDMTLYVSADKNQLPVMIESAVYMGYVRAELKSYSGLKYAFAALEHK